FQACRETDAGPAANSRINADVLLALMLIRKNVSDDAGGRLELEQFLVDVLGIDALQIAFQRAIASNYTCSRQHTAPDRELLRLGLHDLARVCIPDYKVAHVLLAGRRIHR